MFKSMKNALTRFAREEKGQGMAEYGLILALIAIAAILVLTNLGTKLKDKFQEIINGLG